VYLYWCYASAMEKARLHASFARSTGEVRHLLIVEKNGPAFTDLIWFSAGKEGDPPLFQGTLADSRQKADEYGQDSVENDGFTRTTDVQPPPEPLGHAVKLAKRLGHTYIFDSPVSAGMRERYNGKKIRLQDWESVQAKNGGSHKYAVTSSGITAAPQPSGETKHFPFADRTMEF
jgi:hypothetical protein